MLIDEEKKEQTSKIASESWNEILSYFNAKLNYHNYR